MQGKMKILAGNSNRPLTEAIAAYLGVPLTKCQVRRFADLEVFVEIQENVRGQDTFIVQSTSLSGQRSSDGTPDHDRRAAARLGTAHHRGHPLFRLRPARSQARPAHADLGQTGRQPHHPRRRRPGSHGRSPRRPNPGLLRYPDRQSVCRAGHGPRHQGTAGTSTTSWWCPPTSAAWCAPARLAKRIDAPLAIVDKRRERAGESEVMNIIGDVAGRNLHPARRYRRFRRHFVQRRRRAAAAGAERSRPISPTGCCRAARWRGSPPPAQGTGADRHHRSRPKRCASPGISASSRSRR